jgi:hypothetical protein
MNIFFEIYCILFLEFDQGQGNSPHVQYSNESALTGKKDFVNEKQV